MSEIKQVKEAMLMSETIPEVPDCFKTNEEIKKDTDELTKELSHSVKEMNTGRVEEFLLQDLKPDTQRLEIEEVARVIITPLGVEVYTFDDKIYFIEIGGTKIKKMKWVNTAEGDAVMEEECIQVMTVKQ